MNTPTDVATFDDGGEFHSRDTVILIDDQQGDNTVRPASPESLKWFEAERARLAKYGFNLDGTPIKPADSDAAK
jgi:hypothetical protein